MNILKTTIFHDAPLRPDAVKQNFRGKTVTYLRIGNRYVAVVSNTALRDLMFRFEETRQVPLYKQAQNVKPFRDLHYMTMQMGRIPKSEYQETGPVMRGYPVPEADVKRHSYLVRKVNTN